MQSISPYSHLDRLSQAFVSSGILNLSAFLQSFQTFVGHLHSLLHSSKLAVVLHETSSEPLERSITTSSWHSISLNNTAYYSSDLNIRTSPRTGNIIYSTAVHTRMGKPLTASFNYIDLGRNRGKPLELYQKSLSRLKR